jgi:hypothetical protein
MILVKARKLFLTWWLTFKALMASENAPNHFAGVMSFSVLHF